MADFTMIKQMEDIYVPCTEADKARAEEDWKGCVVAVKNAFAKLAERLGTGETLDLTKIIENNTLLTDRSRATYLQYVNWEDEAVSKLDADNAFASLTEEISKFAKYYCKAETPRATQEIVEQYADGKHSTRGGRNQADGVFRLIVLLLVVGAGLGMVVVSVLLPDLSHLLIGGVVALLFGFLFYTIGNTVKK